jgi:crotonobetainyl-CoA:carnitine CoA-transferase CaiB-like acyl-CoA transferase
MANRGKRSIALNLKDPQAMKILLDLVKTADVVQHNMRYDAAERLGIDYKSLKKIKPDLIYCHSRGHEHGPREALPGNDQTGACLTGVQHEDGAMSRGGKPMWSLTSMGDTGNGFLSAIGIVQALYHRDRTGEGQFVDTAIVNACFLNSSHAMARPDGSGFERPRLDPMQTGLSAGCRLYETADGWLCVVLVEQAHWKALFEVLDLASDPHFADADARHANDEALSNLLSDAFRKKSAADWQASLDRAGVPCEVSSPDFSRRLFDNREFRERGWTASYPHPLAGKIEQIGLLFNLSDTPGRVQSAPLVVGDQTEAILGELGYSPEQIGELSEKRVVLAWPPRSAQAQVQSPWMSQSEKKKG